MEAEKLDDAVKTCMFLLSRREREREGKWNGEERERRRSFLVHGEAFMAPLLSSDLKVL